MKIEDLEIGTMLVNYNGEKRVLGVCGEVVFLSDYKLRGYSGGWAIEELKRHGFTIKPKSEPIKITPQNFSEYYGKEVEFVDHKANYLPSQGILSGISSNGRTRDESGNWWDEAHAC